MSRLPRHPAFATVGIGALLVGIFGTLVIGFRATLREQIRASIINRSAAVLQPVATRQLVEREAIPGDTAGLLAAVLESSRQTDMLAVAVFDADGHLLQFAPDSLLFAELPLIDYVRLLRAEPISRFHDNFPLHQYFSGVGATTSTAPAPVLEVLLPLHGRDAAKILGFAQYYIDARTLANELAAIDRRINRQTSATLAIGAALMTLVLALAYRRLSRAQQMIAERNERLTRANFELTLAVKTSALGQITSHLIHGLQGPVAGLRAVVAGHDREIAGTPDWETASDYANRMQTMIQETVDLLGDATTHVGHELSIHELADLIRRRSEATAVTKGVSVSVEDGFAERIDGHRAGLVSLIVGNLVDNAVAASEAGQRVRVAFVPGTGHVGITVSDEGRGIPPELQSHLFEPGRSGRHGGSGLGLAISQLLARQIGAELSLASTNPSGTTFRLMLPFEGTINAR